MKKILLMSVFAMLMFTTASPVKNLYAASSDLWCVGSATVGQCVSSAGSLIPAADDTHNLGSAAKSFHSGWFDGDVTIKNLTVTGVLSPYSTGTFTGEGISLTYGIAAATGVFSGAVTVGAFNTTGNVGIGTTAATRNVSVTGTLAVTGATTLTGATHVTGALDTDSTLIVGGATTLTGAVTISAGITGSGANLTALTAANISGGTLGITVKPYSSADCEALTPAAEGEWCYDTALHKLSISTSTNAGGFEPVH